MNEKEVKQNEIHKHEMDYYPCRDIGDYSCVWRFSLFDPWGTSTASAKIIAVSKDTHQKYGVTYICGIYLEAWGVYPIFS